MQNQALFTILVGGIAGLLGSVATTLFILPGEAETTTAIVAIPEASAEVVSVSRVELEEELDRLRVANNALEQRLSVLEKNRAGMSDRRRVVEASRTVPTATREEQLKEAMASLSNPDGSLAPELSQGVRQAFENFREEEQAEREQRWEEARLAELAARIEHYTTDLNLDEYQATELGALLTTEHERRDEILSSARENGTFMNLREDMRALNAETREGLKLVLTAEQLEQYDDTAGGRFGGGRRRDRSSDNNSNRGSNN